MSFGEVGVDGFFLVSGYLITLSLLQSKSNPEYLLKRVLRIYPGYVAAYLLSLFVVGCLAGGTVADLHSVLHFKLLEHLLFLDKPELASAFQNLPKPYLSGTMWSLSYEFRCYCVLMILGASGVLRSRKVVLVITAILLQALVCIHLNPVFIHDIGISIAPALLHLMGDPMLDIRCCTLFFCGSCFFLFSDKIIFRSSGAIVAFAVLLNFMFAFQFAEAAYAVLGGYILFWFALSVKSDLIARVGARNDLSYGIYLYAWPIQNLVILHFRHISPWLLFLISLPLAAALAFASWVCVERPFLRLKGRLTFVNMKAAFTRTTSHDIAGITNKVSAFGREQIRELR